MLDDSPPAKKCKQDTPLEDDTQMEYTSVLFANTTSSSQLQQSGENTATPDNNNQTGAEDPVLTTVGKSADLSTVIVKTNNGPDPTQQVPATKDLHTQNDPDTKVLAQMNDVIMNEANPLTSKNVARIPDHTDKTQNNQPMDTQSIDTVQSIPTKSYARALTGNNQSKPKYKFAGHRDLAWCTAILTDLALSQEIKAITDHISSSKHIQLPATTQQQIEDTIAFLHIHFTFRGIPPHVVVSQYLIGNYSITTSLMGEFINLYDQQSHNNPSDNNTPTSNSTTLSQLHNNNTNPSITHNP
ncbi:22371_t:CDS:2 [Dentiscutata erythropus]|uniref:22371_t:CDS:1 n=1 Tax=Dentiscutata erythropus TaxID=1348616 RepID=A0A9N9ICT0_9GLOM|nr:22371_t:CDS:2 [Dentiscutata erythropus]